jgi:hypothetical protein
MTDDVVERVRCAFLRSDAPDFSTGMTLDGLRALRPGDELPGGMVVKAKDPLQKFMLRVGGIASAEPKSDLAQWYRTYIEESTAMLAAAKEGPMPRSPQMQKKLDKWAKDCAELDAEFARGRIAGLEEAAMVLNDRAEQERKQAERLWRGAAEDVMKSDSCRYAADELNDAATAIRNLKTKGA